jgi:hypothetical protein
VLSAKLHISTLCPFRPTFKAVVSAGSCKDCVGHRRDNRRRSGLTHAARWLPALDDVESIAGASSSVVGHPSISTDVTLRAIGAATSIDPGRASKVGDLASTVSNNHRTTAATAGKQAGQQVLWASVVAWVRPAKRRATILSCLPKVARHDG